MNMKDSALSPDDLIYIAEMLRAVRWFRNELHPATAEAIDELDENTGLAEASLRRVAFEMSNTVKS